MLRVFTATGKQLPKCKAMADDAKMVGELLAKYNCTLVQGGANMGMMGLVLTEFQKKSDDVVMIVPRAHQDDLKGTKNKEHYIVESESDRLKITIKTCDMIIVLPGGSGTLAELAFYNETKKSGEHSARIILVNTKGFYNTLLKHINTKVKQGFMKKDHFFFEVIKSAKELEPILAEAVKEKMENEEEFKQKNEQRILDAINSSKVLSSNVKNTTKKTGKKSTNKKASNSKSKKSSSQKELKVNSKKLVDENLEKITKTKTTTKPKSQIKEASSANAKKVGKTSKKSTTKKSVKKNTSKKKTARKE